jgi:hypothetical protein
MFCICLCYEICFSLSVCFAFAVLNPSLTVPTWNLPQWSASAGPSCLFFKFVMPDFFRCTTPTLFLQMNCGMSLFIIDWLGIRNTQCYVLFLRLLRHNSLSNGICTSLRRGTAPGRRRVATSVYACTSVIRHI